MTFIAFMLNQFGFHNPEKRLGYGIVPTVFLARHALDKSIFIELFAKIAACILNPTIRMKNEPFARTTSSDRSLQRRDHHVMAQRAAQRPADHQTGEQVDDHRQVQPTRAGGQIRNIRGPHFVGSRSGKIALQKIRRHRKMMLAVSGYPVFPANLGTKTGSAHPPGHSALAHHAASILKLLGDFETSVTPLTPVIDFSDLSIQTLIVDIPPARFSFQPPVISTTRHLKDRAAIQYVVLLHIIFSPYVPIASESARAHSLAIFTFIEPTRFRPVARSCQTTARWDYRDVTDRTNPYREPSGSSSPPCQPGPWDRNKDRSTRPR